MSYKILRHQYPIKIWIELMTSEFKFPEWQRGNCWTDRFKQELILSIINGVDLPKLYIGDIKDTDNKYIIDGGHRSRTIKEFYNNKFHIIIDGQKIFYNKPSKTRNVSSLNEEQRSDFDDYHLDVVVYKNISINDCRHIFNVLQNAQPMSIYDVVNSYQSELVDYSRILVDTTVNGDTIAEYFGKYKFIQSPDKTKIMTKLICWFSIVFPISRDDDDDGILEDISLKYLTEGNNKNSPCLNYIKGYTKPITDENKHKFINILNFVFDYYDNNQLPPTDLNTLIHAKVNHQNFSIEKFNDFLQQVSIYENLKKESEKLYSDKKYEDSSMIDKQADTLNETYNKELQVWVNSRKSGGNNPSGMHKRYEIIKNRCL